ncbi:MAG: hypothetical protein WCS27_08275 [Victivallaceae bacterium]
MFNSIIPLPIILFAVILQSGCVQHQEASLGRLQVGRAGRFCSFGSALLVGPVTARGRNEGYLKSDDEIACIFGLFAIPEKIRHSEMISSGMGIEEYRNKVLRCSLNQNLYPDVFETISTCRARNIVTPKEAETLLRHLFHSNFLNGVSLVAVYDGGAVNRQEARDQFFSWLKVTYQNYALNYYILAGNRNILKKLHKRKLISGQEAAYLLKRWFLKSSRYEVSMIEDMEYFKLINKEEADSILVCEANRSRILSTSVREKEKVEKTLETVRKKLRQIKRPVSLPDKIL